jgi:hypothetical protein
LTEKDAIIVADIPIIVGKTKINMPCWADDELSDDEDDDTRNKYRRPTTTNRNRIVVHNANMYDNMSSDDSYAGYDDDDYYDNYEPDEYDDNEYTAEDAWNSIVCPNWKSMVVR